MILKLSLIAQKYASLYNYNYGHTTF